MIIYNYFFGKQKPSMDPMQVHMRLILRLQDKVNTDIQFSQNHEMMLNSMIEDTFALLDDDKRDLETFIKLINGQSGYTQDLKDQVIARYKELLDGGPTPPTANVFMDLASKHIVLLMKIRQIQADQKKRNTIKERGKLAFDLGVMMKKLGKLCGKSSYRSGLKAHYNKVNDLLDTAQLDVNTLSLYNEQRSNTLNDKPVYDEDAIARVMETFGTNAYNLKRQEIEQARQLELQRRYEAERKAEEARRKEEASRPRYRYAH